MRRGGRIPERWWRRVVLSIQVVAVYIAGLVVLAGNEMLTAALVLALATAAVLLAGLIWRR